MNTSHLVILFLVALVPFVLFGLFFSRHRSIWTIAVRPVLIASMVTVVLTLIHNHVQGSESAKAEPVEPAASAERP